jgi:hypothetical protein
MLAHHVVNIRLDNVLVVLEQVVIDKRALGTNCEHTVDTRFNPRIVKSLRGEERTERFRRDRVVEQKNTVLDLKLPLAVLLHALNVNLNGQSMNLMCWRLRDPLQRDLFLLHLWVQI